MHQKVRVLSLVGLTVALCSGGIALHPVLAKSTMKGAHSKASLGLGKAGSGRSLWADFNGDGYGDLAVSQYGEDVGTIVDAGAVTVMYGSPTGLTTTGSQFWTENSPGVAGDGAEAHDEFGRNISAGDFNGDGNWDLVVGIAGESVGTILDAGAAIVIYGSPTGLVAAGSQFWTENSPGIVSDGAEAHDGFGWTNGAGDFNSDGYMDLALGIQTEDLYQNTIENAGAAIVIYGSANGLDTSAGPGAQWWTEDSPGMNSDGAEKGDVFGRSFASGDFNADGYPDLAIGIQTEDVGTIVDAGAVSVIYGSASGLDTSAGPGAQWWNENSPGMNSDGAETGDWFGRTGLDSGDINGDGYADLAVGILQEDIGAIANAGAFMVIYGSSAGLTSTGSQFWSQDSPGVKDQSEAGDIMGRYLNVGDFDGNGFADVAVGVEAEDGLTQDKANVGAINVLYGSAAGLTATGNQFWTEDSPGVAGDGAERDDRYGRVVVAGDFNGDGYADMVMGGGGENIGNIGGAGAIIVLYGSPARLTSAGSQFWNENSPGMAGDGAEAGDLFGRWLAAS